MTFRRHPSGYTAVDALPPPPAGYSPVEAPGLLESLNDQKLWLLRCSMDVHDKHMEEWGDVLDEVEKVVKVYAANEKRSIRSFNGNSLEILAKACVDVSTHGITYLPSRQNGPGALDGYLMRIRRADPAVYRNVVRGKMSVIEGRQAAGLKVQKVTNVGRAVSAVRVDMSSRPGIIP